MSGVDRIAAERQRQIAQEGWTPEHDDEHDKEELALVAALYASPMPLFAKVDRGEDGVIVYDPWPWWDDVEITRYGDGATYKERAWDKRKKHSRIRRLEIAGALIAAEIDRLERVRAEEVGPEAGGEER